MLSMLTMLFLNSNALVDTFTFTHSHVQRAAQHIPLPTLTRTKALLKDNVVDSDFVTSVRKVCIHSH